MSVLIEPLLSLVVSDSHACQAWGIVLWRAKKLWHLSRAGSKNKMKIYYVFIILNFCLCCTHVGLLECFRIGQNAIWNLLFWKMAVCITLQREWRRSSLKSTVKVEIPDADTCHLHNWAPFCLSGFLFWLVYSLCIFQDCILLWLCLLFAKLSICYLALVMMYVPALFQV